MEKLTEQNQLDMRLHEIQDSISAQIKSEVNKEQNDSQVLFETFKEEYKEVQKGIDVVNKRLDEIMGVYNKTKDDIKNIIE